jgi:two-component system, OmpR family, alkaline phosphatase synthesis response regulator PhoP
MTAQRILVVDDEESILKVLDYALTQEGYEVRRAADAETAEALLAETPADLVILDVMLPGKSGLELARDLRTHSNVPIIMLSARGDEVDRILGLEFGADDYVTKPFSPRELMSRVRAILRRAGVGAEERDLIVVGELCIDTRAREVRVSDNPVRLTGTEYALVLHMARQAGVALSRADILEALHEDAGVGDERAIDVHIHNIREKLEPDPKEPAYLLTVRGFGYRLREP